MTIEPDRRSVVHLLRHGEVENPAGILYGRLPGYHLSERGQEMAERMGTLLAERDVVHVVSSPLERAKETAAPAARRLGVEVTTDRRVIEATNYFEGKPFGVGDGVLWRPGSWWQLRNPFRPSWGEPYRQLVDRMLAAMGDARVAAHGHEAVIVSHQLPIWIVRCAVEGRALCHDPRRRQCTLGSLTSFTYVDDEIVSVSYTEPVIDLVPERDRKASFSAGA